MRTGDLGFFQSGFFGGSALISDDVHEIRARARAHGRTCVYICGDFFSLRQISRFTYAYAAHQSTISFSFPVAKNV